MKPKVKLAVTKILSLQAEFTSAELNEAMEFIRARGLDDIFSGQIKVDKVKVNKSEEGQDLTGGVSKILADLELKDSEKYRVLFDFDALLRSGKILTRLDGIKKIGISIDKDFQPGKSRKDAVPRLIGLLANLPLPEINKILSKVTSESEDSGRLDEGYQNLANFLLTSKFKP